MPTIKEYAQVPREQKLARLERTLGELERAVEGQSGERLARRPDGKNWAPTEIICHLRDLEESFLLRIQQIDVMTAEPTFITTNPGRWAEERQYLRCDATSALEAFGARRRDTLTFLRRLEADRWARTGVHTDSRGRRAIDDFVNVMAAHDDNHLDQLRRALDGRA